MESTTETYNTYSTTIQTYSGLHMVEGMGKWCKLTYTIIVIHAPTHIIVADHKKTLKIYL